MVGDRRGGKCSPFISAPLDVWPRPSSSLLDEADQEVERGGQVSLSLLIAEAKPVGLQVRLAVAYVEGKGLRQGRRALIVITRTAENAGAWVVCPKGLPLCALLPLCLVVPYRVGSPILLLSKLRLRLAKVTCPKSHYFVNVI